MFPKSGDFQIEETWKDAQKDFENIEIPTKNQKNPKKPTPKTKQPIPSKPKASLSDDCKEKDDEPILSTNLSKKIIKESGISLSEKHSRNE